MWDNFSFIGLFCSEIRSLSYLFYDNFVVIFLYVYDDESHLIIIIYASNHHCLNKYDDQNSLSYICCYSFYDSKYGSDFAQYNVPDTRWGNVHMLRNEETITY
jgi:hypothetical protein